MSAAPGEKPIDWTLGPTGMRGWTRFDKMSTADAREIYISEVEKGSPADGVLQPGDVIQGVGQQQFDGDARIQFAKAITVAEQQAQQGKLNLLVKRAGQSLRVTLKLPVMGTYSPTAPFNCPKSRKILQLGCEAIARQMEKSPTEGHQITRSLNALALLASGKEKYRPLVRQQAELLSQYEQSTGVRTWQYGYVNLFLAEYTLATGDRSFVDSGLKRITQMIVDGQSAVGSWGHAFADENTGRLRGYGMMNAPGIPLTISLVLAREAGVEVPGLDEAITRSVHLLEFYIDKGSIPYGDHDPWTQTHDDNGKNGMAAVLFDQLGRAAGVEYFSRMSVASHGDEREMGHTGNFFNMTWALPGIARSGPEATGVWLEEFGWYFDLARRWDGTFRYQGPPRGSREVYDNWDCTGAYLLGYSQFQGHTSLTGRKKSAAQQISRKTAEDLVEDGKGWSNRDRNSYYDSLTIDALIEKLSSWSPTVRERAALALGRRKDETTSRLVRLLESPDRYSQYGACLALQVQRGRSAMAVSALRKAFLSDDLWVRIQAAQALSAIGNPAQPAIPEMLERLAQNPTADDPRNMEQRYLSVSLFNKRGGLLGRSLEGVDRDLLVAAVRAGLTNQDGRSRGSFSTVYENLTFEELQPLMPAIRQAIVEPAPSGIMFADGIQVAGLKLFASHHVDEGMEMLVHYARYQKKHGSQERIKEVMKLLLLYGANAQRVIPLLEETAIDFEDGEEDFPGKLSLEKAKLVRETIEEIRASTTRPPLVKLSE
ncbi:MAG: HEAT repeat domain-containing protein [Planctomycetaceae bacterium]|nr:HEAT repeat domain-containing protein [Planctomycetaceae bacterium]